MVGGAYTPTPEQLRRRPVRAGASPPAPHALGAEGGAPQEKAAQIALSPGGEAGRPSLRPGSRCRRLSGSGPPPSSPPLCSTYGKLWQESRLTLQELLAQELPKEPAKPERNRAVFYHRVATLFVRYLQTARRLEACYGQGVHPQKRQVLRKLLDAVLGRILELKQELVELDVSEYHYMDHVLEELKLTPADLEVPIPKYFLSERARVLQERQEVLAGLLTRVGPSKAPPRALMPREEAVRLIQMAERMRQGRLRARFMWEIRRDEERERRVRESGMSEPNRELAATCIQKVKEGELCTSRGTRKGRAKRGPGRLFPARPLRSRRFSDAARELPVERKGSGPRCAKTRVANPAPQGRWRSFPRVCLCVKDSRSPTEREKENGSEATPAVFQGKYMAFSVQIWKGCILRRLTKVARQMEMTFIGMEMEPQLMGPSPAMIRAQLGEELRRMRQSDYEVEYRDALDHVRDTLYEVEGPSMREQLKEQLRQWFIECHDLTGRFPDYPEEAMGGCAVLFAQKTPEEVRAELDLAEIKAEAKKKEKKKEKMEKGQKEAGKEKDKKGKDKKMEEDEGLTLSPSKFLETIQQGFLHYSGCWSDRDEVVNFEQRYQVELIKVEKRKEVEMEIRLQVDELMREELQKLRLAVDQEEQRATKPQKARIHIGKKNFLWQKKGKKGRKEKDLTPERTIDSLYEELVLQGIIKKPQKVQLAEYSGDFCYLGTTLRQQEIEPTPSTVDVRQNMALYAILRLGCQTVHELAPLVKSLLLAGPAGTGKKMLVQAVCTETGANLFDLSPENLVGKYPGKSGLQMLVHLVLKVARLLKPSVIWVGNAEKTFYKKVPKEEKEFDPRRLKRELPKALHLLKAGDRVLLLGTSNKPYLADVKGLCKTYERVLLIPRPDYASRFVVWQQLIQRHGGVVTSSLDLSALAKVSDGYSQGSLARAVQAVLTERRLLQLPKRPLNAGELLQMLARTDPIYPEEEEMIQEWYCKTPLGKRKLKEKEEKIKAAEAKDKKKEKKKKK
ncbi:IQ and AAA domain-containing protein 1-like [Pogona vitticeps]